VAPPLDVSLRGDQRVLGHRVQQLAAERAAVALRLQAPRRPDRPPAGLVHGHSVPVDAFAEWERLRAAGGRRVTVLDLYRLVAAARGVEPHELPLDERIALTRRALAVMWPGFETTEGSDRGAESIELREYDPEWPARFESWRARIVAALGETALRVEHVGSTAVPGLAAKPHVDVQVSVRDVDDEARYVPQLEAAGVRLRSRDELHRYFRPPAGRPREVHVHVCAAGSTWERDHLLFRDYLRAHPEARDAYAAAKREAARLWSDDRIAYTEAKTDVILDTLEAAEAWAAASC